MIKKCAVEFLGAFAIVFGGCGAVIMGQMPGHDVTHLGVAVTFGLIVMCMVYACGHISGAHFNPAVTIAFSLTRHFPKREVHGYLLAQCLGAVAGSMIHRKTLVPVFQKMFPDGTLNLGLTQPFDGQGMTVFIWEFLLTFVLMFVIMAVATDYRAVGKAAGLAVGGTVCFEAIFAGPITGASMNPARSLGPALVSGHWEHMGVYIAGTILGAIAGAYFYQWVRCEEPPRKDVKGCC